MLAMVRNNKMSRRVSRWVRRHQRRHGYAAVVLSKHTRVVPLTDTADPHAVVHVEQATAKCVCGGHRVAWVRPLYGFDSAEVS